MKRKKLKTYIVNAYVPTYYSMEVEAPNIDAAERIAAGYAYDQWDEGETGDLEIYGSELAE